MSTLEESLREELVSTNNDYRRLFKEHQDQDTRLEKLSQKISFSQQDEAEEKQIKFTKLHLKDQMEAIFQAVHTAKVRS